MLTLFQLALNGPLCMHEALGGQGIRALAAIQIASVMAMVAISTRKTSPFSKFIFLSFLYWSATTIAMQITAYALSLR